MDIKLWDVFFDKNFKHEDGTEGQKIIVVISCVPKDSFLVVKTTSKLKRNFLAENVYVRAGKVFHQDTLIQLLPIYSFSRNEFDNALEKQTIAKIGTLRTQPDSIKELRTCYYELKEEVEIAFFPRIGLSA